MYQLCGLAVHYHNLMIMVRWCPSTSCSSNSNTYRRIKVLGRNRLSLTTCKNMDIHSMHMQSFRFMHACA